jgi:hypothetical protein
MRDGLTAQRIAVDLDDVKEISRLPATGAVTAGQEAPKLATGGTLC